MKTTNKKQTNERANAVNNLTNANKEVKTLSGVIKLLQKFWSNGYKEAFAYVGVSYKDLEYKVISAMCQKDEEGKIYLTCRKQETTENGEKIYHPELITKGAKKGQSKLVPTMIEYNKVVTSWSATTLFKVLEQSKQK
jgi:hypothetical protein